MNHLDAEPKNIIRKPRLLQVTLRNTLLLIAALALLMAWIAHRIRIDQRANAAARRNNGFVYYDFHRINQISANSSENYKAPSYFS